MESGSFGIEIGSLFANRYRVERLLGAGGMGAVYLATDTVLGSDQVALKILYSQYCRDEKQIKRFFREVQLTRKINSPGVVRTFDVGTENDQLYMTMEYIEGISLKDKIDQAPISTHDIVQIVRGIGQGLEAIHAAGVIHRDLKPPNIMILPDGSVKIADFGIARMGGTGITKDDEIVGSAPYMAPELWMGKEVTAAADIYALGVIAYELFTGILPFDGDSPAELMCKHIEARPLSPMEVSDNVPYWAHTLISKMLAKQPELRPQSIAEILAVVDSGQYDQDETFISDSVETSDVYLPERREAFSAESPLILDPPQIDLPTLLSSRPSGSARRPSSATDGWRVQDAKPINSLRFATAGSTLSAKAKWVNFYNFEDPIVSLLWSVLMPFLTFTLMYGLSFMVSVFSIVILDIANRSGYATAGELLSATVRCLYLAIPPALLMLTRGNAKAAFAAWRTSATTLLLLGLGLLMFFNWQMGITPWGFLTTIERGKLVPLLNLVLTNLSEIALLLPEGSTVGLTQHDTGTLTVQMRRIGIIPAYSVLVGWAIYFVIVGRILNRNRSQDPQGMPPSHWGAAFFLAPLPLLILATIKTLMPDLETQLLARGVAVKLAPNLHHFSQIGLFCALLSWGFLTYGTRRVTLKTDQNNSIGFSSTDHDASVR